MKTFLFWDQGNHWAYSVDSKMETFFLRRRATELWSNSSEWSTEHWAMQTFKQHKMGHGSKTVENHCTRLILGSWFQYYYLFISVSSSFLVIGTTDTRIACPQTRTQTTRKTRRFSAQIALLIKNDFPRENRNIFYMKTWLFAHANDYN